jgi:hypothetical protein
MAELEHASHLLVDVAGKRAHLFILGQRGELTRLFDYAFGRFEHCATSLFHQFDS